MYFLFQTIILFKIVCHWTEIIYSLFCFNTTHYCTELNLVNMVSHDSYDSTEDNQLSGASVGV